MSEKITNQGDQLSLEERLANLPVDQRERMEHSWKMLEEALPAPETPEGLTISKVEWGSEEERKVAVAEMQEIVQETFGEDEAVDEMQMEIGMEHGIVDYYAARDGEGKIMSLLSSQLVETKTKSGEDELSLVFWYVVNKKGYKGASALKNLAVASISDFLEKAKEELKPVKALLSETESGDEDAASREKVFNRLAGMKRLFGKDKKGKLMEVPYEAPPEDESTKGSPANFMVRLIDGRTSMPKEEYAELVAGIHNQYTREQYFSPEYFRFLAEQEGEDVDPEDVSMEVVERYRDRYLGIVSKIQSKLEKKLKPIQGDLVLMSERERRET